ncbi:hypothetical protein Z043_117176 [Scleropages formosus]|uniref:SH3 domain-containing protein n=1 Tax=Scleropages formosus TaxID=113540 RepID=A0A0P7U2S0_SCLFO|nr:hypothetical protein Z043_117176 [Scleropages formosus]
MLSGSWRRSAVPKSAVSVPGGRGGVRGAVVLEAQYDYSYRGADGRQVSMHEGERFILLRKANADWWQVRRFGGTAKAKPFYVPATYVVEVPTTPAAAPSPQPASVSPSSSSSVVTMRLQSRASLTPFSPTQDSGTSTFSPVTKTFCRSMENLNSSCAFRGGGHGTGIAGDRFTTLPLSGPPNPVASSSGHLLVPRGPCGPMPRSRSSSNLPQNPYGDQGGASDRVAPVGANPSKSYSQWDMAASSRRLGDSQVSPSHPEPPRNKGSGGTNGGALALLVGRVFDTAPTRPSRRVPSTRSRPSPFSPRAAKLGKRGLEPHSGHKLPFPQQTRNAAHAGLSGARL